MKSPKLRLALISLAFIGTFLFGFVGLSSAILPAGFLPNFVLNETDKDSKNLTFETTAEPQSALEQAFLDDGLTTNTAQRSIELTEVFGGGPTKDGIPALTNPEYTSAEAANDFYENDSAGVLVEINNNARWFSFDILYWHEIINDTQGGVPIAVTFCPLCGSAITFDRRLEDGTELEFGVSGKLWQSNLMMYDKTTESLWSQIEGEAKVGDLTGRGLDIVNSQVINWGEVKNIPNLQVLSRKTGFMRPYGENPYGTYEQNTELMFPVKNKDQSLPPKTIMVAGNYQGVPFALERLALFSETPIELAVGEETLTITVDGGKILVNNAIGQLVPTYNSMWFSWANHWRTDDAVIWSEAIDNTPHIRLPLEANNKVNLIEYLSYGCSYCQQIHNALDAALKETPEVNLELKHFIVYEAFMPIHEAQVCADEQNQGYAFHDQYFKNYYPQKSVATGNQIAQELGLNKTDFASCLASNRPSDVINRDMQEGIALGVTGTPTLLVEGPNTPIRIFSARTKPSILAELKNIK